MFGFGVIATCVLLSFTGYGTEASQPLPLAVYYESYCTDSINFVTQQLYPLMQTTNLSLNIDLKLVPYGKASQTFNDGTYNFTCQHGEKECHGNKVQSCALKYISSMKEQLEFINCVMKAIKSDPSQTYPTQKCGEQIPNIDQVEKCANSEEGSSLLAANGNLTMALNPPLKSVPAVSLNNTEVVDSNIKLKALVCEKLAALNLSECAGTSGSSHLVSGFLSFLTAALLLLITNA